MQIQKIVFSYNQPSTPNVLWARPMGPDSWAFYIHFNGNWQPMKVANGKGTPWVGDDVPYNLDAVGATKLSELEDVSLNTVTDGQVLKYNGTTWENGNDDAMTPGPDTVGTDQIVDDSVMEEDLNSSVRDKIQKTYHQDDESLHMDYDIANQNSGD